MTEVKRLDELELAVIDMFDPAFKADPFTTYAAARRIHPWIAKYQHGYLLLDQEGMRAMLRDDARCRTPNRDIVAKWNAHGRAFERFFSQQMLGLTGAEHKRLRDLVAPAFTPRAASRHRPFMREVFAEILEALGDSSECDINQVSQLYPITVMCTLIGVPREDVHKFSHWLDVLEAGFGQDASKLDMIDEALAAMLDYSAARIAERRKPGNHPDDLLQSLVELAHEGVKLTDEELTVMLVLLLGAGFDTTKNQMNLITKIFCDRPDIWQRVADDPAQAKPVIEEALRFMNPIGSLHRVTNVEIEHRGVLIPANTFLSIPIVVSGRDPAANPDPDVFDPDRPAINHISFGQGIHLCLGQFLARALLEEAVPMLAAHFRHPRLAGEPVPRSPLGMWGYYKLPIAFERGQQPVAAIA